MEKMNECPRCHNLFDKGAIVCGVCGLDIFAVKELSIKMEYPITEEYLREYIDHLFGYNLNLYEEDRVSEVADYLVEKGFFDVLQKRIEAKLYHEVEWIINSKYLSSEEILDILR